jgi:catechol 2,3-dioxygenase-like lactoylglutathione lyase family enzyme
MLSDQFNEVTPVLAVSNMRKSLDYYKNLGFTIVWTWPNEEECGQAGLKIDRKYSRDQIQLSLRKDIKVSGWIFINVSGIDELYNDYKSKKIEFVQEIGDFPWGYREFWIEDPDKNQLRFTMELRHHKS